jgi:hypothetical protein
MNKRFVYLLIAAIAAIILIMTGIIISQKPVEEGAERKPVEEVEQELVKPPLPDVPVVSVPEVKAPAVIEKKISRLEFQKGISYVAWTKEGYRNINSIKSMQQLAGMGVEWVCLVSTWFQDRCESTKIYRLNEKTPSDESIIFAIEKLHELNIKVMLKPHLDVIESGGKWRGEIGCDNPVDWQAWFSGYSDFVLHYARIAEQQDVEMFCIGTELTNASVSQPALWRGLIKKVRGIYAGQLTYAANWYEEFDAITFWDALDYAGIDAYFPLSGSAEPTKEELLQIWQDWLNMLRPWQKRINKPVIFAEIGYKSSAGANEEPWKHLPSGEVDLQLQADCYEALLETFYEEPWFYGIYWWYWGVNPNMGGEFHRGFTPQNKSAQEIIELWYNKPVGQKAY